MTKTPKRPSDLANGETSEGKATQPTSGEGVANALDRWDEEGGAPARSWPLPYETGDLLDAERRVLECLGAALVSEWNIYLRLNAEYTKVWPNITMKKPPPPDSKDWEGKPDKFQFFSPNPGAGD